MFRPLNVTVYARLSSLRSRYRQTKRRKSGVNECRPIFCISRVFFFEVLLELLIVAFKASAFNSNKTFGFFTKQYQVNLEAEEERKAVKSSKPLNSS